MKRIAMFSFVGAVCALVQLVILFTLLKFYVIESMIGEILANSFAYMLSVQLNFLLSTSYTWKDRINEHPISFTSFRRWIAFNAMMLSGLFINFVAFSASNIIIPPMIAGVIALGVSAVYNFILSSTVVFRKTQHA